MTRRARLQTDRMSEGNWWCPGNLKVIKYPITVPCRTNQQHNSINRTSFSLQLVYIRNQLFFLTSYTHFIADTTQYKWELWFSIEGNRGNRGHLTTHSSSFNRCWAVTWGVTLTIGMDTIQSPEGCHHLYLAPEMRPWRTVSGVTCTSTRPSAAGHAGCNQGNHCIFHNCTFTMCATQISPRRWNADLQPSDCSEES